MLYTVLGLYDPAELAIDASTDPLTPRLCAPSRTVRRPAGCRSTRDRFRTSSARHPLL